MFGEDCSKQCGYCRDGAQCNHINGSCLSGCNSGYIGDACNEVCINGTYGIGCIKTCSMFCSVSGICDHVTGACNNGCKNGWIGLDFLEVKECDDNNVALYSVIGVLCVCLLVNVLLLIYFIFFREKCREMQWIISIKRAKKLVQW
ncbi:multiple epidermal growth factor-like domains protein 10 [Saccostrea cucullata]|uniref:multiple epidermal growth factor-like domains protein 10 n=1 Tax=Saccostrea cuccullata TaxID=36930 RepID=UPI002ED28851